MTNQYSTVLFLPKEQRSQSNKERYKNKPKVEQEEKSCQESIPKEFCTAY
jgi:hypothetical protein